MKDSNTKYTNESNLALEDEAELMNLSAKAAVFNNNSSNVFSPGGNE